MKLFAIASVFLLLTIPAYAAEVDGKWTGSVQGQGGEFPVAFTFKADGSKLTGSTTGFDGAEVPIMDGKVDGKNISFTVTFDFGGMPFPLSYRGVVSPDEIKMSGDAAGMPFEFVLKKSK